jgi:hypothetical protein
MWIKYYVLKAFYSDGNIPSFLFRQNEKNELFLSPNVKLCGMDKMAFIESSSLAEKFREACMPRLQKRYGADFDLKIVVCDGFRESNKYVKSKIATDSEIISKRLATGNLVPNRPV